MSDRVYQIAGRVDPATAQHLEPTGETIYVRDEREGSEIYLICEPNGGATDE